MSGGDGGWRMALYTQTLSGSSGGPSGSSLVLFRVDPWMAMPFPGMQYGLAGTGPVGLPKVDCHNHHFHLGARENLVTFTVQGPDYNVHQLGKARASAYSGDGMIELCKNWWWFGTSHIA